MDVWRNVCLLSAMAAIGHCLQCVTCPGIGADSCVGETTKSCPEGNVCAARQQITIAADIIFQSFMQFCAPPNECKVTGTFKTPHSTESLATTCCSEDLCTPEKPKVPDQSAEPNGLECPRCALGSDSCEDLDTMDCTGDETMCRLVTKKQTTGSITLTTIDRGCASQGFCYTSNETSTEGAVHTEITYSCTPGSGASSDSTCSVKTALLSFVLSLLVVLMQNNMC